MVPPGARADAWPNRSARMHETARRRRGATRPVSIAPVRRHRARRPSRRAASQPRAAWQRQPRAPRAALGRAWAGMAEKPIVSVASSKRASHWEPDRGRPVPEPCRGRAAAATHPRPSSRPACPEARNTERTRGGSITAATPPCTTNTSPLIVSAAGLSQVHHQRRDVLRRQRVDRALGRRAHQFGRHGGAGAGADRVGPYPVPGARTRGRHGERGDA